MYLLLKTQRLKRYIFKIQGPNAHIHQNIRTKNVNFPYIYICHVSWFLNINRKGEFKE